MFVCLILDFLVISTRRTLTGKTTDTSLIIEPVDAEDNPISIIDRFFLQVEERSLEILKVIIRRRDRNLTVTNPLRIKEAELDITFPSFTPREPFPATFDGTTTNNDQDGDNIDVSRFTAGDKVAVQAWFGNYVFTNKSRKTVSGPTFRLLKLWRLQAGVSGLSGLNSSPITKRRRIL
ncbi:uncharacterized protein BP5553_04729 [Venustampulla echinocandica]|uniref:Uncharacterized protein n=1 Tax=Venustampulla echinocandica TaxID=2656787 RepID=A0A370TP46_9HELO|nr:uncharacterized protein BP5553_04729 [Venustampulla echinocandica]RDL37296.1 hypothetical protein BP5553_04729 [Venustampulla echinocandica]